VARALVRLAMIAAVAIVAPLVTPGDATDLPQATKVVGTAPDLVGRWLLVATLGRGGGNRSTATVWDVTREADGLQLRERFVTLPPPQRDSLERGDWIPSPDDLDALASAWDTLAPLDRGLARVTHEVAGSDGLDDAARSDPLAAGALWIVRASYVFVPGGSRPTQEHRVFAATARDGDAWTGKYADATIALAPLPIPITLQGSFRLSRVPAASRSTWTRLADVFRGCR
jgi:hypothetical protein